MTRFGIDAHTAVRLVREGLTVSDHQLVAPSVLRSDAMSILYREVRAGTTSEPEARAMLDRLTTMRVRVLGDRVSRGTAWRIATQQGWDDTAQAEYIAVTQLQADALVALDSALATHAEGLVPLASFDDLLR
jgi:predicted nucleic acid-binding protein